MLGMLEVIFWVAVGITADRFFPQPISAGLARLKRLWSRAKGGPDA